jgi:SH3 domain-containing YSC84-like protein 1
MAQEIPNKHFLGKSATLLDVITDNNLLAEATMKVLLSALFGVTMLAAGLSSPAYASGPTEQQVLVDQAQLTLRDFQKAPEMAWFREELPKAKGVLIVPSLVKAGLIFGGSGGSGVYFSVDQKTGECRGPAFYGMGSVTYGLQIGAEKAEVVILAMTNEAVNAMLSPQFKLGADASIAAGPVGVGAAGETSPVPAAAFIAFVRAKGVFAGLTVEGGVVAAKREYNAKYYGKAVSPADILISGAVPSKGGRICAMIVRRSTED